MSFYSILWITVDYVHIILGSADVTSALAAGVRYPIQDSPANLKITAKSPPPPVPYREAQVTQGQGQGQEGAAR